MKTTVVAALVLLPGIGNAAELPMWKLAELADLDAAQWTAPAGEAGRRYRSARAGVQAAWTVPAWWGATLRPPKETVYVLEVLYRDTVETPAVFYSHAGLVRNWRHSEIHRFGGAGDGKWKTARVPVSWDLLCKLWGTDATAFSVRADGADLPIAQVRVRLAGPGDAARFFRETRAWVARVDAARFGELPAPEKTEPVLPEALRDKPLVPFVRPYTMAILRGSAPRAGEAGAPLKLRMTLEEYEPAAFGVYANGQDLEGVTYSVSGLDRGDCRIECTPLTAEYAAYQSSRRGQKGPVQVLPLRLWPAHPVNIPAGQSHGFWITLRTDMGPAGKGGQRPRTAPKIRPGIYTGAVNITSKTAQARIPIEVEVLPIRMRSAGEIGVPLGGCVLNLPPEQEMITYAQHNQCSVHLFGSELVGLENVNGELKLDRANGVTHAMWFFGNPNSYPDTLHLERRLYRSRAKTRQERNVLRSEFMQRHHKFEAAPEDAGVLPEVRPLYTQFVQKLAAHAKAKNWPKLILHPFDEPAKWVQRGGKGGPLKVLGRGPWLKFHFKDAAALIHRASKDVLVGGDIHHAKPGIVFLPDVDVFCTNAIHEDLQLGEKVRAGGKAFWQYKGTNATMPPFAARHSYGFFFGAFDSRGGLVWAMNWGSGFDYNQGTSWMYSWYTPFGTIVSPAYEALREGMDDRRLIETCRKSFAGDAQAMALLKKIFQQVIADRVQGGRDIVYELSERPEQIRRLDQWRGQLLEEILRLRAEKTKPPSR